jgi:hypothetical protein
MKFEGWFLRSDTGEFITIHEHRMWIETPENARKVGVPERIIAQYPEWRGRDRNDFLRWLFSQCQHLTRVRDHGVFLTFETWRITSDTTKAIRAMCEQIGVGDVVLLVIQELCPNGRQLKRYCTLFKDEATKDTQQNGYFVASRKVRKR